MAEDRIRTDQPGKIIHSKTTPTSFSFLKSDYDDLVMLSEFFGSSKSDAVRTAVRFLALHLQSTKEG